MLVDRLSQRHNCLHSQRNPENQEVVDIITGMFGITPEEINPELPVIQYSASSSFNDNYGPEKAFDKIASDGSRWNAADLSGETSG